MKKFLLTLASALLIAHFALGAEPAFQPLFNGHDLTGWDGNPELWKVEDGAIVGSTNAPDQMAYNNFLIWRGGTPKNFELRFKARLLNGNSGVQYRSHELTDVGRWAVGGYQCDFAGSPLYLGMLYEEKGRGIMATSGQRGIIDEKGVKWTVGTFPKVTAKMDEWNEFTIVARGNKVTHTVNGQTTVEVIDHDAEHRALEGVIGLQLHHGMAMRVEFKDLQLAVLPEGGMLSPQEAPVPADAKLLPEKKSKKKAE